jgi:Fungal chitosanase of glycosyl hydrolase group 75
MIANRSLLLMSISLITSLGSGCLLIEDSGGDNYQGHDDDDSRPDKEVKKLLELTRDCEEIGAARFRTDESAPAKLKICGLEGAVFFSADLDIDCDGTRTSTCNEERAPDFVPQTSADDSNGDPLDSAELPYVVLPVPSGRFDHDATGIHLGQVAAVVFKGKLVFAVFGDEGADDQLGAGSVALARRLGIDADPRDGGVDSGVTYVVFTGDDAIVPRLEDRGEAVRLGKRKLAELLEAN